MGICISSDEHVFCFNGRNTTLKPAQVGVSRFGNNLSPWTRRVELGSVRVVVMSKEQAPSRNEGCRTFLLLLLVLGLVEARSGVSWHGGNLLTQEGEERLAGQSTLVATAPSCCVGKVVCVSRPGAEPALDIAGGTTWQRQLAQASPGSEPLPTSLSTDGVPLGSHKLPGPDLGLVEGTRPDQPALSPVHLVGDHACWADRLARLAGQSLELRFRLSSRRSSPLSHGGIQTSVLIPPSPSGSINFVHPPFDNLEMLHASMRPKLSP